MPYSTCTAPKRPNIVSKIPFWTLLRFLLLLNWTLLGFLLLQSCSKFLMVSFHTIICPKNELVKLGVYPSEASFRCSTLGQAPAPALPASTRLGWKNLPGTNNLADYEKPVNYSCKKFYSTGPRFFFNKDLTVLARL